MNRCHREGGWVLVGVVQLMEMFVKERGVKNAMIPIRGVVLQDKTHGCGKVHLHVGGRSWKVPNESVSKRTGNPVHVLNKS